MWDPVWGLEHCRSMDCYLTVPINERKLQELVVDAKDFMYALGKKF